MLLKECSSVARGFPSLVSHVRPELFGRQTARHLRGQCVNCDRVLAPLSSAIFGNVVGEIARALDDAYRLLALEQADFWPLLKDCGLQVVRKGSRSDQSKS